MFLTISRNEIEKLVNENLSERCFLPLIREYKRLVAYQESEQLTQVRDIFYSQLNQGQKSLFMFYTYYNHAIKSPLEMFWWSAYFFAQPVIWGAIKTSVSFFDDDDLLQLLDTIDHQLRSHHFPISIDHFSITREEFIENEEFLSFFQPKYVLFQHITNTSKAKINEYIYQHISDFVKFVD